MKKLVQFKNKIDYEENTLSKSTSNRIYRNSTLLIPGTFSDGGSGRSIYYSHKMLKKYATNWTSDYVTLDHGKSVLDRIGFISNPHYDHGIIADVNLVPVTQNVKDVINLIDAGMIKHLSIEALTDDDYNSIKGTLEATTMEFIGCSIITTPACKFAILNI